MMLYLDTSSLVKLYIEEPSSDEVRRWVQDATTLVSSCVAYTYCLPSHDSAHMLSYQWFLMSIQW
jgi:hypothetical protein